MFHRHRRWRGTARVAFVLAVALIVTSLPAFAGEPQSLTPAPAKSIKVSAERVAKAFAPKLKADPSAAKGQATTNTAGRGSWSFFKSPVGAAILVTVGAGVGYALYSVQHDRIHSAGKQ